MPAKSFRTAPEVLRRIQKDIKWSSLTSERLTQNRGRYKVASQPGDGQAAS